MARILLFGPGGQIGTEIRRRAGALRHEIIAVPRALADLQVPGAAATVIAATPCAAIVNAAAYTAVDRAESDRDAAFSINASAPAEMARAAAAKGVPFIHLSTDYVFDGSATRPYREIDMPAPLGVYGATKLKGEEVVAAAGGVHAILRTSWVFSAHGANFVKSMLRLAAGRESVRVVADQIGTPTPAAAAADAVLRVAAALGANPEKSGTYHFAGDEAVGRADFAEAIFAAAKLATKVERIAARDYKTPARRPAYSALDTAKICRILGIAAPSWRDGLKDVLAELEKERAR